MSKNLNYYVSRGAGVLTYLISFNYSPLSVSPHSPHLSTNSSFLSQSNAESVSPLEDRIYAPNPEFRNSSSQANQKISKQSISNAQTTAQTTNLVRCLEGKTKAVIGQYDGQTLLLFPDGAPIPDSFSRLYQFSLLSGNSSYFILDEVESGIVIFPGTSASFTPDEFTPLPVRALANIFKSIVNSPYIDNEEESHWRTSWSECFNYATTAQEAAKPLTWIMTTPEKQTEPQIDYIPIQALPPLPKPQYHTSPSHYKQGTLTINPSVNIYGKKKPKGNDPKDYAKLNPSPTQRIILPTITLEAQIDPELAICAATPEEQDNVIEFLTTTTNYFSPNPYEAVQEIDGIKESCHDILHDYHLAPSDHHTLSATLALTTPPKSDNYLTINRAEFIMSLDNDN